MKELLDESLFPSLGRIGRGQFAQIHRCGQPIEGRRAGCSELMWMQEQSFLCIAVCCASVLFLFPVY